MSQHLAYYDIKAHLIVSNNTSSCYKYYTSNLFSLPLYLKIFLYLLKIMNNMCQLPSH